MIVVTAVACADAAVTASAVAHQWSLHWYLHSAALVAQKTMMLLKRLTLLKNEVEADTRAQQICIDAGNETSG